MSAPELLSDHQVRDWFAQLPLEDFRGKKLLLIVPDATAMLSFMERAFGAEILSRHEDPDGRVMHAVATIGDSHVMLGESTAEWPPTRAMLHLYVEDVAAVHRRAVDAGGRSARDPEDMFYGDRSGGVEDPWGNQWWIATHVEDVSPEEMERRSAEHAAKAAAGVDVDPAGGRSTGG
jgi:PhnB protein